MGLSVERPGGTEQNKNFGLLEDGKITSQLCFDLTSHVQGESQRISCFFNCILANVLDHHFKEIGVIQMIFFLGRRALVTAWNACHQQEAGLDSVQAHSGSASPRGQETNITPDHWTVPCCAE